MEIMQAINERHSVRKYLDKPIDDETREKLNAFIEEVNAESGLHITVKYDEPDGFDSRLAYYGNFRNVRNYIVLAGKRRSNFSECIGYYGEKIAIYAQQLGLNTCWAALTFNKKAVRRLVPSGEKFSMVISLGYGENQGQPHHGKSYDDVVACSDVNLPDWFEPGVEAALMAPTAVNQQKFKIALVEKKDEIKPRITVEGRGFHTSVDLGIVKYHFEAATGIDCRCWN